MFSKPFLHSNLLIANFQLLVWFLYYPSLWQAYVNRIASDLLPDFALADVPSHYRRQPELKRLRYILFGIQPLLVGFLISLVLWLNGTTIAYILLGVSYGMVLCIVGATISSFTISVAFSLLVGVLGGTSLGILIGITETTRQISAIPLSFFILSVAGSMIATLHLEKKTWTFSWQMGGIITGIVVTTFVLFVGAKLGQLLGQLLPVSPIFYAYAQIIGMAVTVGMAVGMVLGWRLKGLRLGIILGLFLGLFFGSMMTLLISLIIHMVVGEQISWLRQLLRGITGGATNGMALAILFTLPYLLARHIAGVWAGVIAGILGSSGIYIGFAMFIGIDNSTQLLGWSVVCLGVGITFRWWQSLLLYPFESAWNLLLYWEQKRQPERSMDLLRRHSAFWEQHQRFPLWGLETQLVIAYEHDPEACQAAMIQLNGTPQNWAVQAAQIELDIRLLKRCQAISDIAKVHRTLLISDELTGTAANWLHCCRQSSHDVDAALAHHSTYNQHVALEGVINYLNGVLAGARDYTEDVQPFRAIATDWQQIVTRYAEELLVDMPEIPNPYIIGVPLGVPVDEHHNLFVGRTEASKRIEQLMQTRRCPPLLLYGQRRSGKTSLLNNMIRLLPSSFVLFFIDCQGPVSLASHHGSFFYNLARAMSDAEQYYPELKLPPFSEETLQTDPFTRFDEWLDQVEQVTGDKMLLLALDEFVTLDEAFSEKRLQESAILGMFRHIIQHRLRFRLLFSGTHTFDELKHWASYLINVQTVHISYLSKREASRLVEQPIPDFPLAYTPEACQRVLELTHCHPALVQLLCYEIVQFQNTKIVNKRLKVEVEDVEQRIPAALQYGGFFFTDIVQNQINTQGREILRFMATQGEGAVVSKNELQAQFPDDLEETLALLIRRELIEKFEENESYRFQVEMVRRWFSD